MMQQLKIIFTRIFFATCVIYGSYTHAQNTPGNLSNGIVPNVLPASPDASSLGKFGEWPVSQYNGVPNISIALYNVDIGEFNLPIQLSYHSGGVKLDEVSSWVGTNWALNAGGCISRTIVGLPDEDVGGFLYRNQRNDFLKPTYNLNNPADYVFMLQVAKQEIDVEPDIFYFNFGGMSGKFYFDKSGIFQCIPANSLKLLRSPINNTLNYSDDKHWEIADQYGNIYFFGSADGAGLEKTIVYLNTPSASQMKNTGWYLTKVYLVNQVDTVYIDYIDKSEHYDLTLNHSLRILTSGYPHEPAAIGSWDVALNLNTILRNGKSSGGTASTFSSSGKCTLKKIKWRNGEAIFNAVTPRQDVWGVSCNLLNSITINDQNGTKVKEILLNYSFFNQRAYLLSVSQSNGTITDELKHIFEYISPALLPQKNTSFAQDHWGFYNGASSNNSLLPPDPAISSTSLSANREPNETYMQYGTLNKITYPTGGNSTFEYEAHKFEPASPIGGTPSTQITASTINLLSGNPQTSNFTRVQNFTIGFAQNNPVIILKFTNYNKPPSKELAWLPIMKIEKLINNQYQQVYYRDAYDKFPVGNVQTNQYGFVDFNISETISFDPGDYRITTDLICGVTNCGSPVIKPAINAQLTYYSSSTSLPISALPLAGGLRIKQITNYSSLGVFASKKRFLYNPGKLLIYPRYLHQYGENVYELSACAQTPACRQLCATIFVKYKEITSSSQAILGFTQGASVGYTFVREEELNKSNVNNGFIDYNFTYTKDVLNIFNYNPSSWPGLDILNACMPTNSFEYKRGLLESQKTYKKDIAGNYINVISMVNTYDFHDNDVGKRYNTLGAMRVKKMRNVSYPCGTSYNGYILPSDMNLALDDYAYANYNIITSWVEKTSTVETTYDENGNNPLINTSTYTCNNPNHLQVTSILKTDSRGNTIKTDLKYPSDFSTISPYNVMVARNIITPIVEQVSTNSTLGKELSRSKINYQFWQGNTLIKPATSQKSILGNTLETESTIDAYDNKGNIQQITGKDGIIVSLLWGYKSKYPVAHILNTSYNIAKAYVTQSILDAPANDATLRSHLNNLRNIPNAIVTTYTYKPLVGMSSKTDLQGKTTYYTFDNFNRLINIKDQDGNILKAFAYKYLQ